MALDSGTEGFIHGSIRNLEFAADKHSRMTKENKQKVQKMIEELKEILVNEGKK
jgi:hypothetical protein